MSGLIPFSDDREVALAALRSLTSERIAQALIDVIAAMSTKPSDEGDEDEEELRDGSRKAAPHHHHPAARGSGAQQGAPAAATSSAAAGARAGQDGLTNVPDRITPVVGWRAWKLVPWHAKSDRHALLSLHFEQPWKPGRPLTASCDVPQRRHVPLSCTCTPESAPATNCRCGIYAAREFQHVAKYVSGAPELDRGEILVVGRIALWGRVVEYEDGWRAEYGYPQSFFVPARAREDVEAENLLESFGVPVLDDTELVEAFGWIPGGPGAERKPELPFAPGLAADVAMTRVDDNLGLPRLVANVAWRSGAHRLGQLLAVPAEEMARWSGVGSVRLELFRAWRLEHDYGDFPPDVEPAAAREAEDDLDQDDPPRKPDVEIVCCACGSPFLAFNRNTKHCDSCRAVNGQISPLKTAARKAKEAGMDTALFYDAIAQLEARRPRVAPSPSTS